MAAPFPPEALPGAVADPAENEAKNLYVNFGHLARIVNRMNGEADLDLKLVMQCVLHSRKLRAFYDALQARVGNGHTQAQIAGKIEAMFALKDVRWATRAAMIQDLADIYADAGTIADWIEANAAEYKSGFSVNKVVAADTLQDDPIRAVKPPQLATFIANFRARWS